MVSVNAKVSLSNPADGYYDEVFVENIEDRNCFCYADNENALCEMCIYEDGLCFFRQCENHLLELHLKSGNYAKITTPEGILRFDVKVLAFQLNSDILVMHYLMNDEERIIEINYC